MVPAVEAIPHAALGASALFQVYTAGDPAAFKLGHRHVYHGSPWSAEDRAKAAAIAAESMPAETRAVVADVLAEQNRSWESSEAVLEAVERLRDPESVVVVTGQQLGLFAGPLYTVYKAQSTVRLARRLEDETGRPVVPVFWLADEDHDFAEIHRARFSDGEEVRTATYDDGLDPDTDRGAVGRIVLEDGATTQALSDLEAALPDGPERDDALEAARLTYVPGRTMRDAFALLLRRLVPDIVIVSADDARLKRLGAPLFRKEVEEHQWTLTFLEQWSAALVDAGFHAQIDPTPVNLFVMGDSHRTPVDLEGDGFALRGRDTRLTKQDLLDRIENAPETISPNVVLRPLFQDTILPTAAYVAGPGEAAYFAQLGHVYDHFGVPMPIIEPRLSLTVIEPGIAKILDRYALEVADLGGPSTQETLHALWRRLALDASDLEVEPALDAARSALEDVFADLAPTLEAVDAGLEQTAAAARAKALNALERLATTTVRLEKRNHDIVRSRLARAQAALWPGAPQERVLGPLEVAARHGLPAVRELVDAVPLDASVHHLVRT
ncbi:bacillithiol biosynthesis cysteine-adding enzyme BshC [Rubrivirga sp.]|uniref:bacillithiol biosynthesis cysteine-adding enzyme BshC n=1 Tax=Rubrivirga sp. TaxID=1885344 RepID=UPI003C76A4E3